MKNLNDIREEINTLDDELLTLIIKRLDLSKEVAAYKKANQLPITDRTREEWILDDITKEKSDDLIMPLRETYETLFRASRRRQSQLIDPDDSFIQEVLTTMTDTPFPKTGVVAISNDSYDVPVAQTLFEQPTLLNFSNAMKIVDAVNAGLCDYGILPIEDNRSGANINTYDLLLDRTCHIVRGMKLNLHYKLVAAPNVPFDKLKTIVVDYRAYNHCSTFLNGVQCDIVEKTANDIVKDITNPSDDFIAWIVPAHMPIIDAIRVLRSDVANTGDYVRYICLTKTPHIYPASDHFSLMLSIPDQAGGLNNILSPFAALGVNLTLLESRPIVDEKETRHRFFLDFTGNIHNTQLQLLINDLARTCLSFSLLGAYKHVELSL